MRHRMLCQRPACLLEHLLNPCSGLRHEWDPPTEAALSHAWHYPDHRVLIPVLSVSCLYI